MASKNDALMDEDYAFDFDPGSPSSVSKLPNNVTGGSSMITEYMMIPTDRIREYSKKNPRDFDAWPEDKFNELVESIKDVGVLEAITVRVHPDDEEYYELLAGEHRWRASVAAGLPTIPARVIRDCSDEYADNVFFLTNVLRRELTLRDKIIGWAHYFKMLRHKSDDERKVILDSMFESGALPRELSENGGWTRQSYRYARLQYLIDEFVDAVDAGSLSLRGAVRLSALTEEKQRALLPYIPYIKTEPTCRLICELAHDEVPNKSWGEEALNELLLPKKKEENPEARTISFVMRRTKPIIKRRLKTDFYGNAEEIINDALTLYFKEHPECEAMLP